MGNYDHLMNFHDHIPKRQLENGILMQTLGHVEHLNVVHWNIPDGTTVDRHEHTQEQFGLVISGGFKAEIGDDSYTLQAGDSYFLPANVPHQFTAIGDTEAIDVFSPLRDVASHYK